MQNSFADTRTFVFPGLVTGTTASYTTTVTVTAVINGEAVTGLTAQTNAALPTTDANTGVAFKGILANQGTVLIWGQNAAGAIKICQGSIESLDSAGAFIHPPQNPGLPDNFVPFARQLLKAGSTASATVKLVPGVDAWAATGFTNSIKQISTLPNRPTIA